ncbi:MAG: alpha-amylase family glycosyl hydrolase [Chloroflexota bacterium]
MSAWWQQDVIYQIYPRSFMDANNDGLGDLPGVIQQLDYLAWLGVDAIWFSPIFPSPLADFGYDVANYTGIHPDYGTLDDFDRLLVEAHSRNLKVILDLVPNHTSAAHPWFQESRSSRDNPQRDWYIWKDPAPDGGPPNNWISYFGGPAWTFDQGTRQYYMHNFDPGQPELNWRNPEVEKVMFDSIRFWLARGVDGFRIDVIDRILKDADFRDNPPNPDWKPGDPDIGSLLRVYSEQGEGTHEYMRRFRQVFDEFPNTVAIGELAYDLSPEQIAAYYGRELDGIGDELHLPFNFGLLMQPWSADTVRAHVDTYDSAVPAYGWPNYVLSNHDVSRLATRVGIRQARVAAMLLLTLRGTPTLYYGDEIGMTDAAVPPDRIQDPQGRGGGYNRDACRTPMQWDASPNAGFNNGQAVPWLPLALNYEQVNVAAQRDEPDSMLMFYRRLLNYRKRTPALHSGRYYPVEAAPDGCFIYVRQFNDQRRMIVLNLTGKTHSVRLDDNETGVVAVATRLSREGEQISTGNFTLQPDEGLIIELQA